MEIQSQIHNKINKNHKFSYSFSLLSATQHRETTNAPSSVHRQNCNTTDGNQQLQLVTLSLSSLSRFASFVAGSLEHRP